MKKYYQYAADVRDGKVLVGEYIKLAVERFYSLFERDDVEFREERVDYAIEFIALLRHYTGRHAGKPFVLLPWQEFAVANIYGFYKKDEDGTWNRLTSFVYIEMARKNGKSAFAAALCLYHLIADGEANAEVYLAANSKDQAKVSFTMCRNFVSGLDPKHKYLESFRDQINFDRTLSFMKVLAADSSKLDGPNPSMFLLDEYHAAKNSGLKDVLQSGQGMRDDPMGIIITTAGFDKLGPCYQYREMCTEILKGLKTDDTIFALIYSLDEGDNWKDEAVWGKSNPNLGVTVKTKYLREQVQKAINSPSEEVGIKTKNINMWCDAETVWIPEHYIKVKYYLPEMALQEKRFKELYGEWRRKGLITITPGNVTDYDYILNDILDIRDRVYIQKIAYDAWNATQFVINAQEKALPMQEFSQALGNFNRPTKEMERLMLSGKAVIDNNVINRHCFRNVVMARDRNGNTKPSKQFEEKKIDGVIAMLEALGVYLMSPRYGEFY